MSMDTVEKTEQVEEVTNNLPTQVITEEYIKDLENIFSLGRVAVIEKEANHKQILVHILNKEAHIINVLKEWQEMKNKAHLASLEE